MSGDASKVYLRVTAHGDTFRRAGFVFTKATQVIACSPEQAKLIRAEHNKQLKVSDASERDMRDVAKSDAELLAEASAANDSLAAKLDAAEAERASIAKANADASARIAELEAIAAKAHADAKALKSENAKLVADLEAATAPKSAKGESKPEPKPAK